jgi:hypothetical protein
MAISVEDMDVDEAIALSGTRTRHRPNDEFVASAAARYPGMAYEAAEPKAAFRPLLPKAPLPLMGRFPIVRSSMPARVTTDIPAILSPSSHWAL